MTDDFNAGASPSPWAPPPPDWAPSDPAPEAVIEPVARPRRRASLVAVTIAVIVALVGGIVAVTALTDTGTNTPSDAVRGLLTAAGNGDVLGVLDHIDPAERDAISNFITNGSADLKRLGIAGSALDLHHLTGVSATFDNVLTSETQLRPDLTSVHITGGTVHAHFDPTKLPYGSWVQQQAASALANAQVKDVNSAIHFDPAIVTIRRGGTWYVSLGYTAAEAARVAAKLDAPDPNAAVPAVGAASATEAVSDFIRAAAAVDVRRMIELTPPDEMGALHDYAPLFLPKVTAALQQAPPFSVTITTLNLSESDHPGGKLVKVTSLGVHATVGKVTVDLAPGSRCPTITGADVPDLSGLCNTAGTGAAANVSPGITGVLHTLSGIRADVGIVAVEYNGSWYVSPTRTMLDDIESVLHVLPTDFLTQIKNAFNPAAIIGAARSGAGIGSTVIGSSGTSCVSAPDVSASAPANGSVPCPPDTSGGQ